MQRVCEPLHSEGYAIVRGVFGAQDMACIARLAAAPATIEVDAALGGERQPKRPRRIGE
jgi:hypothetical protein